MGGSEGRGGGARRGWGWGGEASQNYFCLPFEMGLLYFTVFTLSIRTPQLSTILVLKFEQVQFTTQCCV